MTGLYIFLGIVLALFLIFSIKARVKLEFNEELRVTVQILCFNIVVSPPKEKKPVNIGDYSFKKHQKRLRSNYQSYLKKQEKKEKKKIKKAEAKAKKAEQKKLDKKNKVKKPPSRSVVDWVNIAGAVIGALFSKFAKKLHIKVARLNIKVATGDAATTAIVYGAAVQSVAYIIEILQRITNIDGLKNAEISVTPDYLSEETSLDLCFVFSLRIRHVFEILFGTLGKAIKKFFETAPPKPEPKASDTNTKPRKGAKLTETEIKNK